MDADDISGERRLEVQKEFMDAYPDIGICGTKHTVIGAPHWLVDYFADPLQIKSELLFFVPLRHPTIMIRRALVEQEQLYYNADIPGAEDYDFFIRASRVTKLSNIMDNDLFAYRRAEGNVSALNKERDIKIRHSLMKNLFENDLQLSLEDKEIDILSITHTYKNECDIVDLNILLEKIVEQNNALKIYDEYALCQTMFHRWSRARYAMNLQFKKSPPQKMIDCWHTGTFYRPWME